MAITGAPGEVEGSRWIIEQVNDCRCFDMTGKLVLEELPALYSISELLVTNDSGPGHFSSITSMPAIILYGPETPLLYGSLGNYRPLYAGLACSPCVSATNHRKTACLDNKCLQAITPEMVFEKVMEILS